MFHLQKASPKVWQGEKQRRCIFTTGFCCWKKALSSFRDHQESKGHLAALTFGVTVPQCGNILEMASEGIKPK